jgi:prepilin-type N-terminal cleavage/methylation domain-containing protein/prepilin-type processing-associated H-X9-DG protein
MLGKFKIMKRTFASKSSGFTLVELLVVIAIIGVLAGLLLPAVQQAREAGRRMSCGNNIRQLMLAAEMFSTTYKKYPTGVHPRVSIVPLAAPAIVQVSALTLMLPYLEQNALYNNYNQKRDWFDATPLAPGGESNFSIAQNRLALLNCPSSVDPNRRDGNPQDAGGTIPRVYPTGALVNAGSPANGNWSEQFAVTDYSAVLGVNPRLGPAGLNLVDQTGHGALSQVATARDADIRDGMSNTIFFAESAGRPFVYNKGRRSGAGVLSNRVSGGAWANPASDFWIDGSSLVPGPNGSWNVAFLGAGSPPTSPSCAINCTNGQDVQAATYPTGYPSTASIGAPIVPVTPNAEPLTSRNRGTHYVPGTVGTSEVYSFHTGGANFVFGDSSVKFISEQTDIREFAKLVTRDGGEQADLPD